MNYVKDLIDIIPLITIILASSVFLYDYAFKRTAQNKFRFRTTNSLYMSLDTYLTLALMGVYIYYIMVFCSFIELVLVFVTEVYLNGFVINNFFWSLVLPFALSSIIIYDFFVLEKIYSTVMNKFLDTYKLDTSDYDEKNFLIYKIIREEHKLGKGINKYVVLRSLILGSSLYLLLIDTNIIVIATWVIIVGGLIILNVSHMMLILTLKEMHEYSIITTTYHYRRCYILVEKNNMLTILYTNYIDGSIINKSININDVIEIQLVNNTRNRK